jgi:hypothetical protein
MPVVEFFSKSSWTETKANGGHWGDRTRSRLNGRVRSVAAVAEAHELGFCTGASDHSWDRRVWSYAQRVCSSHGRSDAVACPVTCDRTRLVDEISLWTLTGL